MLGSCRCFFGPSKRYQNPNQEQFDARVSSTESHHGNKIVAGRPEWAMLFERARGGWMESLVIIDTSTYRRLQDMAWQMARCQGEVRFGTRFNSAVSDTS